MSTFDGQAGQWSMVSLLPSPAPASVRTGSNPDAQNLDTRAIMMTFRPLDATLGDLLVDRAVPNGSRTFYKERSIFLLEEQRDPTGWKTIRWVEPERGFLVVRYGIFFEQKRVVDLDIDFVEDERYGPVPSGWRITELLADGTTRLVSEARVTNYTINQPIPSEEFRSRWPPGTQQVD